MIRSKNYTIAKISKDDALGIHQLMTNSAQRFNRYFPKTLEENNTLEKAAMFSERKAKDFENKEEFLFVLKSAHKVIGLIYIKELDWNKKQGEFAYCIGTGYEGKGLTSKAVKELSFIAFLPDGEAGAGLGLETLQIIVHKDNLPSVRVADKCGFTWQRTLMDEYTPPNEAPLDMELYELVSPVRF